MRIERLGLFRRSEHVKRRHRDDAIVEIPMQTLAARGCGSPAAAEERRIRENMVREDARGLDAPNNAGKSTLRRRRGAREGWKRRIGNGVKDIKKFRRQYANHPASSLLSSALFHSVRFFRSLARILPVAVPDNRNRYYLSERRPLLKSPSLSLSLSLSLSPSDARTMHLNNANRISEVESFQVTDSSPLSYRSCYIRCFSLPRSVCISLPLTRRFTRAADRFIAMRFDLSR